MSLPRVLDSLVTRIILFGVLLVIFGAVARYAMLSNFLRQDLIAVVSEQELALARSIASDIEYKVNQRRLFLDQMAATMPTGLLSNPALLRDWLEERHRLQPLFTLGLLVADTSGRVLTDYPPVSGRVGSSVAQSGHFRAALKGESTIGRALVGPTTLQPLLPIAAPVRDSSGAVQAVLMGATALTGTGFLGRFEHERVGKFGSFLVISPNDQLFLTASDTAMVLKPTPPPGVNLLHDRAMKGFRGSGMTVNAKGVEEISGIASVPGTSWFVVAQMPTSEALATLDRVRTFEIQRSAIGIGFVVLVVGLMVSLMLRPLHQAAEQAKGMARGEIPLQPLPEVREDEVGNMTRAFNRLLEKLSSSQAALELIAHRDTLTGLPNRALLADRMQQALARAQRNSTQLAVLFLDLDGFKSINDTLGHEAGDEALRETAKRLTAVIRETDTLARVGGDEFVLIAGDLRDDAEAGARVLATKCIDALSRTLTLKDSTCQVGVSIGVALAGGDGNADKLLVDADDAMYRAKQGGRGRFVMAPYRHEIRSSTG
jgi:diguanylate cyclase (GGDEF)-like protein